MTSNDKVFFMPKYQIKASMVSKVRILEGTYSGIGSQRCDSLFIPPRLVINDDAIFELYEALEAVKQLKKCGYYSDTQYEAVSRVVNGYLEQHELVFGNNEPVVYDP